MMNVPPLAKLWSKVSINGVRVGIAMAAIMWVSVMITLLIAVGRDVANGASIAASKDLIAPVVAATGVLIAVMAFARDKGKIERDRSEARSKIIFEQCKQGLETSYRMLEDQNNDRIVWIRAARLLQRSISLSASIESAEYRLSYALAAEEVRAKLYEALTIKGPYGERNALPPAFFFGHPEWREQAGRKLEELATATSMYTQVFSVSESDIVPDHPVRNLAESSVKVVIDFLKFPTDFDDPLTGVDWTELHIMDETHGPAQGAFRYLRWKTKNTAIGDKVYPKKSPPAVKR